jgi:FtsP/CotA-like multicopper oxidase with cupredoxin domain
MANCGDHTSAFNSIYTRKGNNPTILLSGRGNVTKCHPGVIGTDIPDPTTITFQPGKKYLLRIINTAYDSTFLFSIDNHQITIVSADFVPIVPLTVDQVHVGIGQRYNIIVEANPLTDGSNPIQKSGNYWIRTHVISNCFGSSPPGPDYNKVGILRYDTENTDEPTSSQWKDLDTTTCVGEVAWKPFLAWQIGQQWNPNEQHDVQFVKRRPFTKTYTSTYPLQAFALATPSPTPVVLQPLRVDYEDITFAHFLDDNPWPEPWVVVSEDSTSYYTWVSLSYFLGKKKSI